MIEPRAVLLQDSTGLPAAGTRLMNLFVPYNVSNGTEALKCWRNSIWCQYRSPQLSCSFCIKDVKCICNIRDSNRKERLRMFVSCLILSRNSNWFFISFESSNERRIRKGKANLRLLWLIPTASFIPWPLKFILSLCDWLSWTQSLLNAKCLKNFRWVL